MTRTFEEKRERWLEEAHAKASTGECLRSCVEADELEARRVGGVTEVGCLRVMLGGGKVRPWRVVTPRGSTINNRSTKREAMAVALRVSQAPFWAKQAAP